MNECADRSHRVAVFTCRTSCFGTIRAGMRRYDLTVRLSEEMMAIIMNEVTVQKIRSVAYELIIKTKRHEAEAVIKSLLLRDAGIVATYECRGSYNEFGSVVFTWHELNIALNGSDHPGT